MSTFQNILYTKVQDIKYKKLLYSLYTHNTMNNFIKTHDTMNNFIKVLSNERQSSHIDAHNDMKPQEHDINN
jgi:hypothetical protein